jgi:predicted dehydrogenase
MFDQASLDAVVVMTPISALAPVSQAALRCKIPVLQFKPAAADSASASESIRLAQANNVVFMVGENYRYHREYKQMRAFVEQGVLGQPRFYHFNDLHLTGSGSKWFTTWRKEDLASGGYLVDGGVHAVASIRQISGSPIRIVQALSASIASEFSNRLDNLLLLNLTFADGFIGQAMLSNAVVEQETRRHKIFGDQGTLALLIKERRIEFWPAHGEPCVLFTAAPHDDDYLLMFNDFYRYVVDGITPASTAEDALIDLQVIEAGLRSARLGMPVTL